MLGRVGSRAGLAWALWALTCAFVPAALVAGLLGHRIQELLPEERESFLPLIVALAIIALVYATVGAIVASRRPGNAIGWIFCLTGLGLVVCAAAYGYADQALYRGADLPLAELAAWVTGWLFIVPVFVAPCLALFLFPDGRPPGRSWRPLLWLACAFGVLAITTSMLQPGELDSYPGVANPVGVGGEAGDLISRLDAVGEGVGAPLFFLLALASVVARYRRAGSHERLQLKWVAFTAAVMIVCFALSFVIGEVVPGWASGFLFLLGFAGFGGIAVAAGYAILRHRLYDIDRVVNRTLVYGLVTAGLAGLYFGIVLLLQLVFDPITRGSDLAIAVSTLAVAALFRPARSRVQALIDRRFYRRRYDAQRTLAVFGTRLRDEVDLDALSLELRGVVRETMQPAHVTLWLRTPDGRR